MIRKISIRQIEQDLAGLFASGDFDSLGLGGSCVYCACSSFKPCIIPENMRAVVGSDTCSWIAPLVCSAPACVEKYYQEFSAAIQAIAWEGIL